MISKETRLSSPRVELAQAKNPLPQRLVVEMARSFHWDGRLVPEVEAVLRAKTADVMGRIVSTMRGSADILILSVMEGIGRSYFISTLRRRLYRRRLGYSRLVVCDNSTQVLTWIRQADRVSDVVAVRYQHDIANWLKHGALRDPLLEMTSYEYAASWRNEWFCRRAEDGTNIRDIYLIDVASTCTALERSPYGGIEVPFHSLAGRAHWSLEDENRIARLFSL
jgi:hypothetical protein